MKQFVGVVTPRRSKRYGMSSSGQANRAPRGTLRTGTRSGSGRGADNVEMQSGPSTGKCMSAEVSTKGKGKEKSGLSLGQMKAEMRLLGMPREMVNLMNDEEIEETFLELATSWPSGSGLPPITGKKSLEHEELGDAVSMTQQSSEVQSTSTKKILMCPLIIGSVEYQDI